MIDRCALCGSSEAREIFRRFGRRAVKPPTGRHTEDLFGQAGDIVRCQVCRLVRQRDRQQAPYQEAEDLEYLTEEAGIRQTFRAVLERVGRYSAPPGRLLDIGCGPGFMLDEARALGWETAGIEPSEWGAGEAQRRGHNVICGTLETADVEPTSFDVIVAADVIEHVADPVDFARRIHSALAPSGVVFIATPNVESLVAQILRRWWWSIIPNHLWFFAPSTLSSVFSQAGYIPLEITTHPKTFSIEYYAGRFGGYSDRVGRIVRRLSHVIGGGEKLITPNFRDRVAFIARKS